MTVFALRHDMVTVKIETRFRRPWVLPVVGAVARVVRVLTFGGLPLSDGAMERISSTVLGWSAPEFRFKDCAVIRGHQWERIA